MYARDRNDFERSCIARGRGIQRHNSGLMKGLYIDNETQFAWEMVCAYAQLLVDANRLQFKPRGEPRE